MLRLVGVTKKEKQTNFLKETEVLINQVKKKTEKPFSFQDNSKIDKIDMN